MTEQQYKEWAKKILELLPEAKAVAVDEDRNFHWFGGVPVKDDEYWYHYHHGYLGDIDHPDWKNSLVVKEWVPENGETYWTLDLWLQRPVKSYWFGSEDFHLTRKENGLVFKTKEEAQAILDKLPGWIRQERGI